MASGDPCAYIIREIPPNWAWVAFTSGSTEPSPGDTLHGDTSDETAILEVLSLESGTWGGGDAAGWMFLSNLSGAPSDWSSGENFTEGSTTPANHGTLTGTPAFAYATLDMIDDTPVHDFDDTVNEAVLYLCQALPNWTGSIDADLVIAGAANTGDMSFGGAFRRIQDDTSNLVAGTAFNSWSAPQYNTAIDAPSVVGETTYDAIAFASDEYSSIAAGELFFFLLFRDAQDGTNDDMSGDASVLNVAFTLN